MHHTFIQLLLRWYAMHFHQRYAIGWMIQAKYSLMSILRNLYFILLAEFPNSTLIIAANKQRMQYTCCFNGWQQKHSMEWVGISFL